MATLNKTSPANQTEFYAHTDMYGSEFPFYLN